MQPDAQIIIFKHLDQIETTAIFLKLYYAETTQLQDIGDYFATQFFDAVSAEERNGTARNYVRASRQTSASFLSITDFRHYC